jgi:hypothetical protein
MTPPICIEASIAMAPDPFLRPQKIKMARIKGRLRQTSLNMQQIIAEGISQLKRQYLSLK